MSFGYAVIAISHLTFEVHYLHYLQLHSKMRQFAWIIVMDLRVEIYSLLNYLIFLCIYAQIQIRFRFVGAVVSMKIERKSFFFCL